MRESTVRVRSAPSRGPACYLRVHARPLAVRGRAGRGVIRDCGARGHAFADTVAVPNRPAAVAVEDRVARAVLRRAMPGILGVVDPQLSLADRVALARAIAGRLCVGERLTGQVGPGFAGPAGLGRVVVGRGGGGALAA